MSADTLPPSLPPPPRARRSTIALLLALLMLIVASFVTLSLKLGAFLDAASWASVAEFLHGFAPPEMAPEFLAKLGSATLETLAMSALGTALAVLAGGACAVIASGRTGSASRSVMRTFLNLLRSIPELVWASMLLITAGLGPFAGTLALAAHTSGVLGRLFAEALDNVAPEPAAILRANGSRALPAFLYATLPQASPQLVSYTLYRWENNIRAAAVLGVVGAGGLGQMLKYHLSLFQMQQAASVILAMLLLVALVDSLSFALRRHMNT